MSIVGDLILIVILFAVYAALHSFLASNKVKESFRDNFGNLIAFYRFGYNLFALVSFYVLYEISPKPHLIIYDLPTPFDLIILIPQFAALIGLFWTFRYICIKELLGLNQIKRYFRKNYSSKWDEDMTLNINGPFKYSRHPIYLFSMIFLMFRPTMDLFYLTFFLLIVAYFYIGSFYEEKKLVQHFGEVYVRYQKSVPRFFPVSLKAYESQMVSETESN